MRRTQYPSGRWTQSPTLTLFPLGSSTSTNLPAVGPGGPSNTMSMKFVGHGLSDVVHRLLLGLRGHQCNELHPTFLGDRNPPKLRLREHRLPRDVHPERHTDL